MTTIQEDTQIKKVCKYCNELKSLDQFTIDKTMKFGKTNKCKECYRIINKIYYAKNADVLKTKRKKRKSEKSKYDVAYARRRRKEDPDFRLNNNIRDLIRKSIKKGGYTKNSKTYDILGIDYDGFKKWIESQWLPGMTWANMGKGSDKWNIDHTIPMCSAINEDEIYKLNHYTNLSPLWEPDNLSKNGKYKEEDKQAFLNKLLTEYELGHHK
jgi:hypothetical protein